MDGNMDHWVNLQLKSGDILKISNMQIPDPKNPPNIIPGVRYNIIATKTDNKLDSSGWPYPISYIPKTMDELIRKFNEVIADPEILRAEANMGYSVWLPSITVDEPHGRSSSTSYHRHIVIARYDHKCIGFESYINGNEFWKGTNSSRCNDRYID